MSNANRLVDDVEIIHLINFPHLERPSRQRNRSARAQQDAPPGVEWLETDQAYKESSAAFFQFCFFCFCCLSLLELNSARSLLNLPDYSLSPLLAYRALTIK